MTTDTMVFALREVIGRGRTDELKTLLDKVTFDFDPAKLRKRDDADFDRLEALGFVQTDAAPVATGT